MGLSIVGRPKPPRLNIAHSHPMDDFIVIHEGAGQFPTGFAEGILLELPQVVEHAAPLRIDQEETITPVAGKARCRGGLPHLLARRGGRHADAPRASRNQLHCLSWRGVGCQQLSRRGGRSLELRVAPVAPEPLVMLLMRCQVKVRRAVGHRVVAIAHARVAVAPLAVRGSPGAGRPGGATPALRARVGPHAATVSGDRPRPAGRLAVGRSRSAKLASGSAPGLVPLSTLATAPWPVPSRH
jgi:hypothetical protein